MTRISFLLLASATFLDVKHELGMIPDVVVVQVRGKTNKFISEAAGKNRYIYSLQPLSF